jgi:hypothetical protein
MPITYQRYAQRADEEFRKEHEYMKPEMEAIRKIVFMQAYCTG